MSEEGNIVENLSNSAMFIILKNELNYRIATQHMQLNHTAKIPKTIEATPVSAPQILALARRTVCQDFGRR